MKHFLLLFFCTVSFAFAQDNKVYEFKESSILDSYDITTKKVNDTDDIIQKGWRFTVDHKVTNGYIIRFLKWTRNTVRNTNFYSTDVMGVVNGKNQKTGEIPKFFFITNGDFLNKTAVYINKNPWVSFVTGAITIPIKIRPGGDEKDAEGNLLRPFDFNGEVNIGLSVGLRIKLNKTNRLFLIPSGGINLTSISIDENTVKNGVITSKTNASSLTPFIGIIGEYDNFQLAIVTGWDSLAGKTGENWIYQGKPWFGIGLGYNIFNTGNNQPNKN